MKNGSRDLVRTGIFGLDNILLGGIPSGNIILVEGITGTGKTLFGTEFVYRGITEFGEPGMIVVFETVPEKLIRETEAFGWHLQEQPKLKIIFTSPSVLYEELRSTDSVLLETASEIGARRIFIDGISLLLGIKHESGDRHIAYREILQDLIQGLHRHNLTAILSHELVEPDGEVSTRHIAEFLADTVIHLKREHRELSVHRTLEVIKSRGQDFDSGKHSMAITEGYGIQVFRRVQLPLRRDTPQATTSEVQSAIGVDSLDQMLGGGLLRGSTTITAGISGVGKSILGMQLLREGAVKFGDAGLIVDNIIVMNFVELGNELRRSITVAKSRSLNNWFGTREFVIGEGGISIVADERPPLPALPFSRYYGLLSRAPTRISPDLSKAEI